MNTLRKLVSIDTVVFHWCLDHARAPGLTRFSRLISKLGDGGFYLTLGITLALFEAVDGIPFLMAGLLAFAIELPLYLLLKNTIKRDRPCDRFDGFDAAIVPSDKFSFPSGHAAAAFLFATVISNFYPTLGPLSYTLAALIGLSRVMLGVHYPCDIAAGALLGIGCAALGLNIFELF
ncbi:phosphatase PAP2 family protein [Marinobacterium arenosum]|uniref:phosphatase PAP2 family protein n=1 Tax=Marinobacterium arenosum TaxID=2862496 RepID=UPI001C943527|nr:phosphatase PAP2 family protein [Marinobacterium arenosum]MBY4678841.1 phosphatase PAP2 family protein [Marinobacterium arenosum]